MRMSDMKKVLKEIKEHCKNTPCEKCQLHDYVDGDECFLYGYPCDWLLDEIFESLIEKEDWRQEV